MKGGADGAGACYDPATLVCLKQVCITRAGRNRWTDGWVAGGGGDAGWLHSDQVRSGRSTAHNMVHAGCMPHCVRVGTGLGKGTRVRMGEGQGG